MIPYDLTIILFTVITLTLTLYFTLLVKIKPSSEVKLLTYMENIAEEKPRKKNRKILKTIKLAEPIKSTELPKDNDIEERECPHYVGYLTTLPKGSPFPDECFGCRKVIQCLRIEPTKVIESFYLDTTQTK